MIPGSEAAIGNSERRVSTSQQHSRDKQPVIIKPKRQEVTADDKNAHPSWKAKNALKEKFKVDFNASAGKKITFDD